METNIELGREDQKFIDQLQLTIEGKLVQTDNNYEIMDPSTGLPFATVPDATLEILDAAVRAASDAFRHWSQIDWQERRAYLIRFCDAVVEDLPTISRLVAQEAGKPLAKAEGEVKSGINFAREISKLVLAPEVFRDNKTQYVRAEKHPIGVVGAITAWNYPVLLAFWKIAPAILTGNTLILKPAPSTPLATLRLGEIAREILPPGVLNVLSGGDDLGRWMTSHTGISKISFTGSVDTGRSIMAGAAPTLKRLTLELGGNDAAIILPDFDIATQAEDLFWAAFSNNGQVCACMKRTYVPDDLYDALCDKFAEIASTVKIGPWNQENVQLGPLQNRKQLERVTDLVEETIAQGTTPFFCSNTPSGEGYFYPITLFRDVPDNARLVTEEQFGPILPIMRYSDIEDAIARANDSIFGLGASVWGQDIGMAASIGARLQAGNIFVNQHPSMGPDIPYGGIRQSGIGVEGGIEGLAEYTNTVVLNIKK